MEPITIPLRTPNTAATREPESPARVPRKSKPPRSREPATHAVIPSMEGEKSRDPELITGENGETEMSRNASASHGRNKLQPRRGRSYPNCAATMAMLTLRPVLATPVPRFHIEPKLPTGTLTVIDRSSNEPVRVYSPRFTYEFRAGYQAGRWYLRSMTDVGTTPRSPGFRTAREAIAALATGRWRLTARDPRPNGSRALLRALWP
jgi:hypothetical protein